MERSVRALWRGGRRRHLADKDAAASGQPAGPVGPALSALDDTSPIDRVPPSLLAASRDLPSRSAAVRLAVNDSKVIAVVGTEGGDPYEWWNAIYQLASRSGAS